MDGIGTNGFPTFYLLTKLSSRSPPRTPLSICRLYGQDARTPTETALSQPRTPYQVDLSDYKMEMVANLSDAWALAHAQIEHAQKKQKQQKKQQKSKEFKVGDRVKVHMPGTIKGKVCKFAGAFYGPYRVLTITPTNAEVRLKTQQAC